MAGKTPAFQFYPNDWIGDPDLASCSLATRGFWIACLCRMWHCVERGVLRDKTFEGLGRLAGCTAAEATAAVKELEAQNVARVTNRNQKVTIVNRRMVREDVARKSNADKQKRHREKNSDASNPKSNRIVTLPSSSSSSSSSSSTTSKTPCSPPLDAAAEAADAMYAGATQPPPAQLGDAKRHMQQCYREAFNIDSNIAPVANFARWVERLMEAAGGHDAGLAHVRSFIAADFCEANNAFFDRTNRAQTWSGTWVENAWVKRHGKVHEDKADADREKFRRESAEVDARAQAIADKTVQDGREAARTEAAQIDEGWAELSVAERQKWIQDNPPHVIFAKKAWWAERNKT